MMNLFSGLQGRLAAAIGVGVVVMWLGGALLTNALLRKEMEEVFDSALQETAQRVLPLAAIDILERDEEGINQRIAQLRDHEEYFTYLVRDQTGRILMQSSAANPDDFPPIGDVGFRNTATHRIYDDKALQGSLTITVAEPLAHRAEVARETVMTLALPLLIILPFSLLGILFIVRLSLRPVNRLRLAMASKGASDLTAIRTENLPNELVPVEATLNRLLERLSRAFRSERDFASAAAHELRTPVAAALAQTQRLLVETTDPATKKRAQDIEASLKRLTRLSEKLMQLARAEGARLIGSKTMDIRQVITLVAQDVQREIPDARINVTLPETAVLSAMDPDAIGILTRNLVENAAKHGLGAAVDLVLDKTGALSVRNSGPIVPADQLIQLTDRFQRGATAADGSGLGLSIVKAITDGSGARLTLLSPASDREDGFEAAVQLPIV